MGYMSRDGSRVQRPFSSPDVAAAPYGLFPESDSNVGGGFGIAASSLYGAQEYDEGQGAGYTGVVSPSSILVIVQKDGGGAEGGPYFYSAGSPPSPPGLYGEGMEVEGVGDGGYGSITSYVTTDLFNNTGGEDLMTSPVVTSLKALAMLIIIVVAILGNTLVIVSVFRFERLRIIANSFIVSMAFADLLVASLVMPFKASIDILEHWKFGKVVCDLFNANDVLFSTASLLHLCCISLDRYIAVTDPFHYETKMTKGKVALMLGCVWGASALLSHAPIHSGWYARTEIGQNGTEPVKVVNDLDCSFEVNQIYAVVSSTISFWCPVFIMVFTYVKIFREARKQEQTIRALTYQQVAAATGVAKSRGSRGLTSAVSHRDAMTPAGGGGRGGGGTTLDVDHIMLTSVSVHGGLSESRSFDSGIRGRGVGGAGYGERGNGGGGVRTGVGGGGEERSGLLNGGVVRDDVYENERNRNGDGGTGEGLGGGVCGGKTDDQKKTPRSLTPTTPTSTTIIVTNDVDAHSTRGGAGAGTGAGPLTQTHRKKMQRENKAAKTLGIIMGAFLFCWLPFFTWYLTTSVCAEACPDTPIVLIDVLFWIGYFNSALNPIIYAFFNRDFRDAFRRLLRLRRLRTSLADACERCGSVCSCCSCWTGQLCASDSCCVRCCCCCCVRPSSEYGQGSSSRGRNGSSKRSWSLSGGGSFVGTAGGGRGGGGDEDGGRRGGIASCCQWSWWCCTERLNGAWSNGTHTVMTSSRRTDMTSTSRTNMTEMQYVPMVAL